MGLEFLDKNLTFWMKKFGGASEESSKDHLVPKKVYYNVALCFGGLKNAPWGAMDFHDFMCVREFSSKTETA